MAFLGIGKKKQRGPSRTGADRKAGAEAKLKNFTFKRLKAMEERGDPRVDEYIMSQLGMTADTRDPIATMAKQVKTLRDIGFIDDPKAVGTQAEIAKAMAQYGPLLAPLLGSLMGGRAPALPPAPYQPPAGYRLVPIQQEPPPPQVAPADAPAQLPPQSEPTPEPAPVPAESMPVTATSKAIIAIIEPMSAKEAADWLISQRAPFSEFFVNAILRVPDDHLSELPDAIAHSTPDVAGVMAWLKARPEWFAEFTREVRRLRVKK